MDKIIITKAEAQDIWDAYQDFDFLKDRFSTFKELWKWCQEYNELSELEWLILLFHKFN